MLYALGLGDSVVAISHECDYPPEARDKPRATRTTIAADASSGQIDQQVRELLKQGRPLYELDRTPLAELEPDLIVTQAQCDVCAVRYADVVDAVRETPALQRARVLALNPQSLDDVLADIVRLGDAVAQPDAAREYVGRLQARVEAIRVRTRALPLHERPRVACIEWIEPLMIAGNWMPQIIDLAGGRQSLAAASEHSSYVPWEAVRQFDPQVIVVAPCGFDLPRTLLECSPLAQLTGWAEIAAVRQGRVFAADGNAYFNRSGPRLVDTLELLAHLIHPGWFPLPASLCKSFSAL